MFCPTDTHVVPTYSRFSQYRVYTAKTAKMPCGQALLSTLVIYIIEGLLVKAKLWLNV